MTVLKRSLATWHGTEGWFAFGAYFTILALPFLATGFFKEFLGDFANTVIALIATGWLVVLVLVYTPYQLWRDEKMRAQQFVERMKPKLIASYDNGSEGCRKNVLWKTDQRQTGTKGISIRVQIDAATDATVHNCSSYLTKIEYSVDGTEFVRRPSPESKLLHWANENPEFAPVNVYPGVSRYIGVCESIDGNNFFRFRSSVTSFAFPQEFETAGKYRFTIIVVANDANDMAPLTLTMLISWNGVWSEISAELLG